MLFHVAATAQASTFLHTPAELKATLDAMKAEGVVLSACSCVDGSGYFFVVEAGDVEEAAAELGRLSRVADHPLAINMIEVHPA
jgi:hypothetical protein